MSDDAQESEWGHALEPPGGRRRRAARGRRGRWLVMAAVLEALVVLLAALLLLAFYHPAAARPAQAAHQVAHQAPRQEAAGRITAVRAPLAAAPDNSPR